MSEKVTASGREPEVLDGPTPTEETLPDGQKRDHWVLPEEERAKGFVRPVRRSYRHVGPPPPANLRDLTPEEQERYQAYGYVKFEEYGPEQAPVTGRFWTQAQLDRLTQCGAETTMPLSIAETYARNPAFYGSTFCCRCGSYFPVGEQGEFVWDDGSRVGT